MVRAHVEDLAVAGDGTQFMVLLKTETDEVLPIVIGYLEAMSIAAGKTRETLPRPMTHDLMLSMMSMLNAEVKRIEITELKDNTFYAHLVLERQGIEFELDARPSDALALAVRVEAPLFISEKVIEEAAMSDFSGGGGGVEA